MGLDPFCLFCLLILFTENRCSVFLTLLKPPPLKTSDSFTRLSGDFPGNSVVKTLSFHCRGHMFDPLLGKFHVPHSAAKKKEKTLKRVKSPTYE